MHVHANVKKDIIVKCRFTILSHQTMNLYTRRGQVISPEFKGNAVVIYLFIITLYTPVWGIARTQRYSCWYVCFWLFDVVRSNRTIWRLCILAGLARLRQQDRLIKKYIELLVSLLFKPTSWSVMYSLNTVNDMLNYNIYNAWYIVCN